MPKHLELTILETTNPVVDELSLEAEILDVNYSVKGAAVATYIAGNGGIGNVVIKMPRNVIVLLDHVSMKSLLRSLDFVLLGFNRGLKLNRLVPTFSIEECTLSCEVKAIKSEGVK